MTINLSRVSGSYTQSRTNSEEILCQIHFPSIVVRCFRLRATLKLDMNVRLRATVIKIYSSRSRENNFARECEKFQFRLVSRAAPRDTLRTMAVRDPARRDGRRFAFPVRGISFRVLGSFPKQTETGRLNGHRIATASPNYRKRERNANSTGTSTSCASYRGSF